MTLTSRPWIAIAGGILVWSVGVALLVALVRGDPPALATLRITTTESRLDGAGTLLHGIVLVLVLFVTGGALMAWGIFRIFGPSQ